MSVSKFIRRGFLAAIAFVALAGLVGQGQAIEAAATTTLNVRSGPGVGFAVVDTLHAGEVVDVVECNAGNTWCRIFHEGPDGWVSRTYLGPPGSAGVPGAPIEFGVAIPLPGGGYITFGTPGYVPPAGGAPGPGPATRRVCVYDLPNYGGARVCLNAGRRDANVTGAWNNRVTSLRVFGGARIRLCQDRNYGRVCNVFVNNRPLLGAALNNRASSYDVMPPRPRRVCVYDLPNYRGNSRCVNAGASDNSIGPAWNNRVTSLKVFGGARIRLCQNPGFGGFCNTFSGNRATLGAALNNRASSYRTW